MSDERGKTAIQENRGSFLDRLSALLDWWEQNPYARLAAPAFFTFMGAVITTHYASFADPVEMGNPLLMAVCVLVAFAASFTRHRFPRASLAVECTVAVVAGLNDWSNLIFFSFALAVYRVVARCKPRDAVIGTVVAYVCYCLAPLVGLRTSFDLAQGMSMWFVMTVLFALVSRMLHKRQLVAREAQAEHEAREKAEAQRAQAVEKNRIAGELHDSVGHDLTAIIALSEGLAAHVADEELARALASINELARAGLADTRKAVKALSVTDSAPDDAPSHGTDDSRHGIEDIRKLLDTVRKTGVAAAFMETGQRADAVVQSDLAFRVAREGITNALRHAHDMKRLTVSLDHRKDGWMALAVRDDGMAAQGNGSSRPAEGTGLARLRRTVEDAGGALHAEPRETGGWELRAELAPSPRDKGPHQMSHHSERTEEQ